MRSLGTDAVPLALTASDLDDLGPRLAPKPRCWNTTPANSAASALQYTHDEAGLKPNDEAAAAIHRHLWAARRPSLLKETYNAKNSDPRRRAARAFACATPAYANLNVFACEPEWGALSTEIGGDKVQRLYRHHRPAGPAPDPGAAQPDRARRAAPTSPCATARSWKSAGCR